MSEAPGAVRSGKGYPSARPQGSKGMAEVLPRASPPKKTCAMLDRYSENFRKVFGPAVPKRRRIRPRP
jgi:hypothetical protein